MSEAPKRRGPSGPSLPPHLQRPNSGVGVKDRSKSPGRKPSREESAKNSKREDWMTELPEGTLKLDPSNLKTRQFIHKPQQTTPKVKSAEETMKERDQEAYIAQYNQTYRTESLAEIHKRNYNKKQAESDEVEKKFDWERDMHQATKGGSAKDTSSLLGRIGSVNSRFAPSSSSKRFL